MIIHSSIRWMLVWVVCLCGALSAQENGTSLSLQELIAEALDRNPKIKSAERRWRAWQARPSVVSALPDPRFSYTRFGSSVETRVGPQENVLTLSQQIPFPGKLGLKGNIAKQDALLAKQDYQATRDDVVLAIKRAYHELYWIDRSLAILDQYLSLLQDFSRVAEQKYATGQGIQANVLKSQVEISSIVERRFGFERMRHHMQVRINAILDRPEDTELVTAAQTDTIRKKYDKEQLLVRALSQREELQAARALIDKSTFMRKLAKKNYLPDFRVQANYIDISRGVSTAPDAGKNAWSVEFGLNLPIWVASRTAAVSEADEILASNRLSYDNLENQVKSELSHLHHELHLTDQTLRLYEEGLLTQAESSVQSALASYRTGRIDFLSLLDAHRVLLNLNLNYVKERADYQKQLAALERAVGGDLPHP